MVAATSMDGATLNKSTFLKENVMRKNKLSYLILIAMMLFATRSEVLTAKPNILFAFADDWGRHAGVYGTDWLETPVFDRIANEGILFNQAYTAVAKCAPLIIMSSDHGMPFPRAKGDTYMAGNHVPLSIMWKNRIVKPGRICNLFVNFVDLAPTILELAGIDPQHTAMEPIQGRSLVEIFRGDDLKNTIPERLMTFYGRERHDVNIRPGNKGYPSRAIRTGKYLYTNNLDPSLPPTTLKESGGIHQFTTLDKNSDDWQLLYGKRPADELYDVEEDPECVRNLALNPTYVHVLNGMKSKLYETLREQDDPRMYGKGEVFDNSPATVPWREINKERKAWEKKNSRN